MRLHEIRSASRVADLTVTVSVALLLLPLAAIAQTPKAPVPSSPYLGGVYRHADEMLAKARKAAETNASREASLHLDHNFLRLLYTLSELSSKPIYRESADAELKRLLESAASGAEGWALEPQRPWLLWDRLFDLEADASLRLALRALEHTAAKGGPDPVATISDRHAGFHIRAWAVAGARTKDERFSKAIEALLDRLETKRASETARGPTVVGSSDENLASSLSLAIDCDGAAHLTTGPLATRLRALAALKDDAFCSLPHDIRRTGGFLESAPRPSGKPTPLWLAPSGGQTTAQVGLLCVSRYENTGRVAYRELIHAAADAYFRPFLDADLESGVGPAAFGHAISLELAAWRSTAQQRYLDRARELADRSTPMLSVSVASPGPASPQDSRGAATLALALLELHLHILYITAVRCPPNTSDR